MATYFAMVRVEIEADDVDEARSIFMEAVGLVDDSDLGQNISIDVEVDFEDGEV
jgi:hypothetical protein